MTNKRWHFGPTVAVALCLGLAVGTGATIGVQAVRAELDSEAYSKTDPGAAIWQCSGAEVVAVAELDDGIVQVHLSLTDHQHRGWELMESPYYSRTDLEPLADGSYRPLQLADGDTDDGPSRLVSLRVAGGDGNWCRGTVSLT
ncbi:hypothetical protein [Nocardioides sp. WS12]|uniref:hypothetical protein n=1 Tax=Nocardioides sp. WS12 TaxID=2486272 RepID=UPI0015FE7578|nr:hypothetical protein [Nocardioides sp. WS12]